jgi:[protein-PII] uridylyltransferase
MDSSMTQPALPPSAVRPAALEAASAVAELRRRVAERHAADGDAVATCRFATDLFDDVVRGLWSTMQETLPAEQRRVAAGMTLVAHGGYGRREMSPSSDIDLMLLHDGRSVGVVAEVAARLVQDLFDAGLQVGQSVRTPAEAVRLARDDATILSTLLDARAVVGPTAAVDQLASRLRRMVGRGRRSQAVRLIEARREEADRHGHTVSLLEPNVKRSPGGLRDIQLAHWLGVVLFGAESWDALVASGGITAADATTLRAAASFLTGVRLDLHLAAGRAADELTRDRQAAIADARGIRACDGLLGVELFMREYIGHTRGVKRIADSLSAAASVGGGGLAAQLLGHAVERRFRVGPGSVAVLPGQAAAVGRDPAATIRFLELGILHGLPIEASSWEAVRAAALGHSVVAGDREPAARALPAPAAVAAFLAMLEPPSAARVQWQAGLADLLHRLHDAGLLELFIPGFAHARDLPQFNNYHKYTIDEHSILTLDRCLAMTEGEDWLARVWQSIHRPRPLLLAALMHDLGKGHPGDHSEVGAAMAKDACQRLGLPADETTIVEFLIRHHLLMSHVAFRRDLGDDSLVARFARQVGSPGVLRLLTLLTAADVTAVGPGTWTTWKSDLLHDLYARTLDVLSGEAPAEQAFRDRARVEQLLAERAADDPVRRRLDSLPAAAVRGAGPARVVEELGRLCRLPTEGTFAMARWQRENATVLITVGTEARFAAGVFHRVTAALAAERLEILAADIHTLADGDVLDRFTVRDPDFAGEPPAERLSEIASAIREAARRPDAAAFQPRWNPFAPQVRPAAWEPVRVAFDNDSSRLATIVEVFAHDSPGLLSRLARVIFEAGLSVQAARIGTYRDQVVDAFHVTTAAGAKVDDPALLDRLARAIERAAEPITGPGRG